ncbi:MAG TPA: DNA polymerase IV [Aldersonia sp.]
MWVLHVDLDQFQVAVERLRRPDLVGTPVIVGGTGDPTQPRKVVTCASYEARAVGVHAGMPLRLAYRKCPDATFLPLDHAHYEEISARVMGTLRTVTPLVEVLGWDEAFLGLDADPEQAAATIRERVGADDGLACSVGIGDNKQRAKLATGFAKPGRGDGVYRLTADTWMAVMAHRPTSALWGIGSRITKRLADLDIHTVADLAHADRAALAAEFGPQMGPWLQLIGRGGGSTEVHPEPRIAKGRSRSVTYPEDLTDRAEIRDEVVRLAKEVADEVLADGRVVERVAVTVRTKTFYTRSRSRTLPAPSTDVGEITAAALVALDRFELDRPVRLLGVRVDLAPRD